VAIGKFVGNFCQFHVRVAESPLFMLFSTACPQKTRIKCGENACIQLPLM